MSTTRTRQTATRFQPGSRGFTLTEVLVATTVFTIIVLAALMIYDRSNRVFKTSVESGDMQQNTRAGFDRLVSDIRMAGFDYDRDGVPIRAAAGPWQVLTTYAEGAVVSPVIPNGYSYEAITGGISGNLEPAWPASPNATISGDGSVTWRALGPVFQQPDEQIEYAGRSAVVVRANYDFHTDAAHENGREKASGYEPSEFPVVTTANDEIVAYALRSDVGGNDDTLTFYADVDKPRSAYPGGSAEAEVEITNVDLCDTGCNNPPYTLYRFTIQENGSPDAGTPIANNIRDLQFRYYTDLSGTTLLADADGTAIPFGAIGGDGQYDASVPANIGATTNFAHRAQRALIVAISTQLIGMGAAPDPDYTHPTETIASVKHYRQYSLQSHITPRNLGLAGMAEPSGAAPGAPTILSVCTGACRVTRVGWAPPLSGTVQSYEVRFDTSSAGSFSNIGVVVPGDVFSAPVTNLTPGTTYYFKVVAVNENGEGESASYPPAGVVPVNKTQPAPPSSLQATEGTAAQANQITVQWQVPSTNVSPLNALTCAGNNVGGGDIDPGEPIRYGIYRGTTPTFTLADGELVLAKSATSLQPAGSAGSTISWADNASNSVAKAPANCKDYYYRIFSYDTCSFDAASAGQWNDPASVDTGTSAVFPSVTGSTPDPAIHGYAVSTIAPAAPGQPTIDYTNSNSECVKASNSCDVKILWPKVTADTANPTGAITVDQYRIKRERKKASDATWVLDTYLPVVANASSDPAKMQGASVVAHDTSALDHDPIDKRKYYYRYTVTALQCGAEGAGSPTVVFPESCGLAASMIIESGAASGNGSLEAPWVMNASDTIEVIPPTGVALNKVEYEIFPEPNNNPSAPPVDKQLLPNSPFVYGWNDQSDGAVYRVVITMTNDSGCTEQTERFIQDDPVGCPSSTVSQTGASSGGGTESSPWVMNAGDTVYVNEPPTGSVNNVKFEVTDEATGVKVIDLTDAVAPYGGVWTNQIDNHLYKAKMTVTFNEGCTQEIIRYIKDEAPPVCVGATVSATGAASGTGATEGTAWLLNGGDVLTVNPPVGGTINQVVYTITAVNPAGASQPPTSDSTPPFTLTWPDLTDNTVYSVASLVTYASGCTETKTVYVKDQVCSGSLVTQTGSSGAGTGLTAASRWVFNAGDKVTVAPPAGSTLQSVQFVLLDGATQVSTSTDVTAPYEFTWADLTNNKNYTLMIYATFTAGCVETITRYVQDQGECFISVSAPVITHADSGARREATVTFTVTNPSAEVLTPSAIKVSWLRDAAHPSAVLKEIQWRSGATTVTQTVATANNAPPGTGVLSPSTPAPLIPASSSAYQIALVYDIGKKSDVIDLGSSWVGGLCLQYTAPSFGGLAANCNVLGSTTGNPSTCN